MRKIVSSMAIAILFSICANECFAQRSIRVTPSNPWDSYDEYVAPLREHDKRIEANKRYDYYMSCGKDEAKIKDYVSAIKYFNSAIEELNNGAYPGRDQQRIERAYVYYLKAFYLYKLGYYRDAKEYATWAHHNGQKGASDVIDWCNEKLGYR